MEAFLLWLPTADLAINNNRWKILAFSFLKLTAMGKFLQTFVAYHGCGNCYQNGTNKIDKK